MLDVVVIGAGPAGSAAALHAAKAGLRVLLLDRAEFPRAKACGDALSARGVAAVRRMGAGDPDWRRVEGAALHAGEPHDLIERFAGHPGPGFGATIARRELDAWLLAQACAAGAQFETGCVEGIRLDEHGRVAGISVRGTTGRRDIDARSVVAATGANSPDFLRRHVCYEAEPARFGVALRGYVRARTCDDSLLHVFLSLRSAGEVVPGYGWLFPMGDGRANVGVGLLRTDDFRRHSLSRLLHGFCNDPRLRAIAELDPNAVVQAGSAPLRFCPLARTPPGLLVAGDLAGLTNPLSGEGISIALETGELAAHCIAHDRGFQYTARLRATYARYYGLRPLLDALGNSPQFAMRRGVDMFVSPERFAGRMLRRVVWNLAEQPPRRDAGRASRVVSEAAVTASSAPAADIVSDAGTATSPVPASDVVCDATASSAPVSAAAVAERVIAGVRATAPGAAVLIRELIGDPEVEFGVASLPHRAGDDGDGVVVSRLDRLRACAVVEAAALLRRLHLDLSGERGRERSYGCDTMALLAIDALTAHVMTDAAELDASKARELLGALCERFAGAPNMGRMVEARELLASLRAAS